MSDSSQLEFKLYTLSGHIESLDHTINKLVTAINNLTDAVESLREKLPEQPE